MTLHDRLYLRFGLFHKRWGHAIAYMLEFLIVWVIGMVVAASLYGAVMFAIGVYQDYTEAQKRVAKAEAQKVNAEQMLLACLRGGVVGRTETSEIIGCEGATSFRM